MSGLPLFDLDEVVEDWTPIFKPFGGGLAAYIADDLCRDCGAKSAYNQGGAREGGSYMVCDDCAQLDACTTRPHNNGPEWHVSHWGNRHRADEHDALVLARQKRRARYLAHRRPRHSEA